VGDSTRHLLFSVYEDWPLNGERIIKRCSETQFIMPF
jgi:hypothetical protein